MSIIVFPMIPIGVFVIRIVVLCCILWVIFLPFLYLYYYYIYNVIVIDV